MTQQLNNEAAKLCPTLCSRVDSTPPGSSVHGIFQARILQWIAISFPGDLPDPGIKPASPALQAEFSLLKHQGSSKEDLVVFFFFFNFLTLPGLCNVVVHFMCPPESQMTRYLAKHDFGVCL